MKSTLSLGVILTVIFICIISCSKGKEMDEMSGLYDIYIYDCSTASNTNITNSPDKLEYPLSFTNDGSKILFRTIEGVFTMNPDGSDARVLIPLTANDKSDIQLSNDGEEFAYTNDGVLYLMNYDGTNERRLTNNEFKLWKPVWSKDGKYIACCSDSGIVTVNMDGNIEIISTERPASWYDWSFDSKKLAYSKYVDNRYAQIFVFDLITKIESKITSFQRFSYTPYWRPGTAEILFTSSLADYGSDLILMSADASVQKNIFHQNFINSPAWSPDGNRIAFINENSDIAIIDVKGGDYKVLNNIPKACMQPVWSPDGRFILYFRAVFYN